MFFRRKTILEQVISVAMKPEVKKFFIEQLTNIAEKYILKKINSAEKYSNKNIKTYYVEA